MDVAQPQVIYDNVDLFYCIVRAAYACVCPNKREKKRHITYNSRAALHIVVKLWVWNCCISAAACLCSDVRMQRTMFYLRPDVQNYYAPLSNGCMPPYSRRRGRRRETMNKSKQRDVSERCWEPAAVCVIFWRFHCFIHAKVQQRSDFAFAVPTISACSARLRRCMYVHKCARVHGSIFLSRRSQQRPGQTTLASQCPVIVVWNYGERGLMP